MNGHPTDEQPPLPNARPHGLILDWLLRLMTYPLVCGSGAVGLTLLMMWARRFSLIYGDGPEMRLSVSAALMVGLALGAWGLSRLSERMARPLLVYAVGALIVGVFGFLMPTLMPIASATDGWLYGSLSGHPLMLGMIRCLVSLALTIVPTALIGAGLPIVVGLVVSAPRHTGLKAGWLYAAFTLGAGGAVALTGLVLMPRLGLYATEMCAAGLSLLIGTAGLVVALRVKHPVSKVPKPLWIDGRVGRAKAAQAQWALSIIFVSGLISMATFGLWVRSLSIVLVQLNDTTYAYGACAALFLIGLSIGCGLVSMFVDHQYNLMRLFGLMLTLLGMSILVSVLMVYFGGDLFLIGQGTSLLDSPWGWAFALANLSAQTLGVLGMPAMLTGMAAPPAIILTLDSRKMGSSAGRLFAIYILGGTVGGLIGGLMVGKFSMGLSLIILGAAQTVAGLATLHKATEGRKHLIVLAPLALLLLGGIVLSIPASEDRGLHAPAAFGENQLFYEENSLETVAVLQDAMGYKAVYRQGLKVADTRPSDITCQKMLVHLPMVLHDNPQRILLVGFGNGGTAYAALRHDRALRVDAVVSSMAVLKASVFQAEANHTLLKTPDSRFQMIIDDDRNFIEKTDTTYDLITVDFTDLRRQSQARRFEVSFFEACGQALNEEGMIAVWLPLEGLPAELLRPALATFHQVFPESAVFCITSEPIQRLLLIGNRKPWSVDYGEFVKRISESDVRDDLGEYYLDDAQKLLSFYVTGGQALGDFVAGSSPNTADHPRLEYLAPRNVSPKPMAGLEALLEIGGPVQELIKPETIPPGVQEGLKRYAQARPWLIKGHRHFLAGELEEATGCYLAAREITPGDLSLKRNLLTFPSLQQWISVDPANPKPYILLGRLYMLQPDKLSPALDLLIQVEKRLRDKIEATGEADENREKQLADIGIWMREIRRQLERDGTVLR